jgi:hypothetical protein
MAHRTTSPRDRADALLIEHVDDLGGAGSVAAQASKDWLFIGEGLFDNIAERYRVGEAGIAFRYSQPNFGWDAKEHGFIMRALPREVAEGWPFAPFGHNEISDRGYNRHQPLVLPHSVEVMEGVQKFVPSAVWPQCFDCEPVTFDKPRFAFSAINPTGNIVKSDDGLEDREMSVSIGYYAFATRKGGCQKIETAADCVDDDSRFDIEAEIGRPCPLNYDHAIPRIQILLGDDCIWARPLPGFESLFHKWDLGFGPIH